MPPADAPFAGLPPVPAGSSIERRPFGREALDEIASELGQPLTDAPFALHGEPVWRLTVPVVAGPVVAGGAAAATPDPADGAVTVLTFWLSLGRVDAVAPAVSVVATGIIAVDLVPGVEAIFRYPGGNLTVARNGRIMVRTGPTPVRSAPEEADRPGGNQE